MVITNIIGGLGNQMFQYACGRALGLSQQQPLMLASDQFDSYSLHNGFELQNVFSIQAEVASEIEVRRHLGWCANPRLRWLLGRPCFRWLMGRRWVIEPHYHFWEGLKSQAPPMYLHGYWQSEKYFKEFESELRNDFEFQVPMNQKDLEDIDRMSCQPSISLHVRRGDYAHNKNKNIFNLLEPEYYRRAIAYILGREPGARIFAFSDDPDWVTEHLCPEFGSIELVNHNSGQRSWCDMRLMSRCNHNIIANSSFSWWGGWLNSSPEKMVVAPINWFADGRNDSDLIPESWVRV